MKIFISESLSDANMLYHGTSILRAMKILSTGKFLLRPASKIVGREEERHSRGKNFYLSLTRRRDSSFLTEMIAFAEEERNEGAIVFLLDFRKLVHKYKIVPVQFFTGQQNVTPRMAKEFEERLLSNHPSIEALQYVREMFVIGQNEKSNRVVALAKQKNIPIRFYADIESFERKIEEGEKVFAFSALHDKGKSFQRTAAEVVEKLNYLIAALKAKDIGELSADQLLEILIGLGNRNKYSKVWEHESVRNYYATYLGMVKRRGLETYEQIVDYIQGNI